MQTVETQPKTPVYEELADGLILRRATEADRAGLLQIQKEYLGADSELEIIYLIEGNYPGCGIEDFLVVVTPAGQIVSALMLAQVNFRVGQTWLKLGQPEFVATHPDYRGRGLIRKQFEILDRWMQEQQLPIAIIGGIDYFYRQFGYEYGLQTARLGYLKPEHLGQLPVDPTISVRRATPADAPAMYTILTEHDKTLDWQIQTAPESLVWSQTNRKWENSSPQDYVAEQAGQILSFARVWQRPEGNYPTSIYGNNLAGSQALAAYILQLEGLQKLRIGTAHNTTFINWLQTNFPSSEYTPVFAWYVKVNDAVATFQALAGEFERRVAASSFAGLSQEVILGFYRYQIRLLFEEGKIREVTRLPGNQDPAVGIPPDLLPKLIMGFRSVDELAAIYPDFNSAKHWDLVRVLFPKLQGQMRFFIF